MKITFLGHATFYLETGKTKIIVDPFITGNKLAKDKVEFKSLKPDYIFLTHAHNDHILDVEEIGKSSGATVLANFEVANYFEERGLKVHPMNHGGKVKFDFGTVKYVNAIHTSSFENGSYGGQPGGFIISASDKHIYIAGDTALTMDMKLIPMFVNLDLAILPIGDNFTMGVEDAVVASDFVECDKIVGCHYDTFGYIEIDHDQAVDKFKKAGKELLLLEIGESITI